MIVKILSSESVQLLLPFFWIQMLYICFLGCMLCFGQSAFFRFNHPEEALKMKSMMPQGGSVSTGDYRLCAGTVWRSRAVTNYTLHSCVFAVFSRNTGPVWINTRWPFITWITKPKEYFSPEVPVCRLAWIDEWARLLWRAAGRWWRGISVFYRCSCLHSNTRNFSLFNARIGWRKCSIRYM